MTEKIYLSPVASKTVDAKLQLIEAVLGLDIEVEDVTDYIRSVQERNDLDLETTEDAPYA